MNLADELTRTLAFEIAERREAVLIHAVTLALGSGWSIADIEGRVRSVRIEGTTYETFTLDQKPLVQINDTNLEQTETNVSASFWFCIPWEGVKA